MNDTPDTNSVIVTQSKVKAYLASKEMRTDGTLVEALSQEVYRMLDKAVERATTNGRSTVRPGDL